MENTNDTDRNLFTEMKRTLSEVSDIVPLDKDEYEIKGKTKKKSSKLEKSSYLNRVITYYGKTKAKLEEDDTDPTCVQVESFIGLLMRQVTKRNFLFSGIIDPCGSFYEKLKVKYPNEFDYIWALGPQKNPPENQDPHANPFDTDKLIFRHMKPDTFKPRSNDHVFGRTYFKIYQKDNCNGCSGNGNIDYSQHNEIQPREIQKKFHELLTQVASGVMDDSKTAHVKMNGPAVTLFVQKSNERAEAITTDHGKKEMHKNKDINPYLIKIDISLAIPIVKKDSSWPFQKGRGNDSIDIMIDPEPDGSKCHMVTAGDFWRLSFSTTETNMMKNLTREKPQKYCYLALKSLRDDLALTGDHESTLLGTYPLKVTFMKENQKQDTWTKENISERSQNILNMVEQEGAKGSLTNYFVRDDPVLLESDRSYLECRRLRLHLQKMNQIYKVNGYIHTVIMILFVLCHMSIFSVSVIFVITDCPTDSKYALGLADYVFAVLPLSFLGLSATSIGIVVIIVQLCCLMSRSLLYEMFHGPLPLYIIFAILNLAQGTISAWLAETFDRGGCQKGDPGVLPTSYAVAGISALILTYLLFHVLMFAIFSCHTKKGMQKSYCREVIFFDFMYRELCVFLKCCGKSKSSSSQSVSVEKKREWLETINEAFNHGDVVETSLPSRSRDVETH